jgi:alkanesulfonate monooxygenase SsuD/methylene tetrahydromethanopterin reductase-like flavin-dependent oxidoreductase (luciferase family)
LSTGPDGSGRSWADQARKVEDLGFSTLLMPDHFGDQLAPVPALMAAADATTTLKVGALVFDNDYRHPLILAKEAATLDRLSDGRLELGLGAGWMRSDYEESGIAYDPPSVRVDRFEEGGRSSPDCSSPRSRSPSRGRTTKSVGTRQRRDRSRGPGPR